MSDTSTTMQKAAPTQQGGEAGERARLALNVSVEVESIVSAMLCDPSVHEADNLWKRALLARLKTLSHIAMDALDDDREELAKLRTLLDGTSTTQWSAAA